MGAGRGLETEQCCISSGLGSAYGTPASTVSADLRYVFPLRGRAGRREAKVQSDGQDTSDVLHNLWTPTRRVLQKFGGGWCTCGYACSRMLRWGAPYCNACYSGLLPA